MIDARIMDCVGSLLNKNSESRGLPLPEDRGEDADCCSRGSVLDLNHEQRWEIISAYLEVLENLGAPIGIEADLPYPKEQIRFAICRELVKNPNSELRDQLEIAYMQLEIFLPYDDYKTIADFKNASMEAEEMADPADPTSLIRWAGVMKKVKGDRAVKIQEAISKKMRERLVQIQEIGAVGSTVNCVFENSRQVCS
jgi:hypothetical protein